MLVVAMGASVGCVSAPRPAAPPPLGAPAPRTEPSRTAATTPRTPEPLSTGLVFAVEPVDAEIAVDGQPRGTVGELADARGFLPLPPGIYQVSLKATGYVTWRAEVAVRSSTEPIRVKLTRKP
jgi:hypothetical protein